MNLPNKRPENMERITTKALADAFIAEQVREIRAQVGEGKVLLALSGDECNRKGMFKKGDRIVMSAFGAGFVSGALIMEW